MQRGQSKSETGKGIWSVTTLSSRSSVQSLNAEAERQHKEHQIDLAEQELKQVKSDTHRQTQKRSHRCCHSPCKRCKFSFGSGKIKSLERKNEDLRDEIAIRDETIRATAIQHQANAGGTPKADTREVKQIATKRNIVIIGVYH